MAKCSIAVGIFILFFISKLALPDEPSIRYDFSGKTAEQNKIVLQGAGFGQYPAASVTFGSIPTSNAFQGASDGAGAIITAKPGEGIMFFGQKVVTKNSAIVRCSVRTDKPEASVIIATIGEKPNIFVSSNYPENDAYFLNHYLRIQTMCAPPANGFLPVIQIINTSKTETLTAYLDNLEIFILQPNRFYNSSFLDGDETDPPSDKISIPSEWVPESVSDFKADQISPGYVKLTWKFITLPLGPYLVKRSPGGLNQWEILEETVLPGENGYWILEDKGVIETAYDYALYLDFGHGGLLLLSAITVKSLPPSTPTFTPSPTFTQSPTYTPVPITPTFTPPPTPIPLTTVVPLDLPAGAKPLELILIENGTFTMGDSNWSPSHQVTINKPFYIGKNEITQAQWQTVMGTNPSLESSEAMQKGSFGIGDNYPVYDISWDDCQLFLQKLNELGQGTFRLPSEAEWEYACRAGSVDNYYWGQDESGTQISKYAWYVGNTNKTQETGTKLPNAWGLFDMSGNVWEWCQDWYGDYSTSNQIDPAGPSSGQYRVIRGGAWSGHAGFCQSAFRNFTNPRGLFSDIGLRIVRNL